MNKISIIIPAYNEEKRIENTLEKYSDFFEKLRKSKKLDYEILIVINNTKDRTEEIVKRYAKKNEKIRYMNLIRGGKGYAVTEGCKDALKRDNDFIGFVDADMSTKPEDYFALLKFLNNNDAVIASRYLKGSVVSPKPMLRRIIASRVYNSLIRALFLMPYRDTQCGAKIFRRIPLMRIIDKIGMTEWAFDIELIYLLRTKGYSVAEIPTVWSDKEYSKINFMKAGPFMALSVIRLRIFHSPLKRFIRVYDWTIGLLK